MSTTLAQRAIRIALPLTLAVPLVLTGVADAAPAEAPHVQRSPRASRPPRFRHHPHPKTWRWKGAPTVIVLHPDQAYARAPSAPAVPPEPDRPAAPSPPANDDRNAAGGIALAAGATSFFGLVPLRGDLMAGARLHLALAAPSESSRWLSSATFGLTGGVDTGQHRGVDAQVYHAGAVVSLGAPWSRDVLGISVEGGLLGSRYYDGNAVSFKQSTRQTGPGPIGEGFGPQLYGLGRLILQAPIKGDVRPFIAGEFGVTERHDDKLSAIAGLTGGVVWNAW